LCDLCIYSLFAIGKDNVLRRKQRGTYPVAIRFIRQNAKNKILVNDIVKITQLGRRSLEQRFKKTIHRSVYNEIRRMRVELISKMLIETNMPISQITSLFNFTDVEHISRYFKKEKGIGLREFRKLHQPR
jgi:LacI family transcriptional regulator